MIFAKVLESREPQTNQKASGRALNLKLAWNTQKNKMSDVKGKEMEQERKGRIKNDEIDLKRTNLNFDLVENERHLYHRVKDRVDYYREQGSRVQKNSVVMYSNIITLSKEEADRMGETRTKHYFKTCKDYFSERFGEANVVSAKVHMDESAPHMHLHFIPVNHQGRLSARTAMNRQAIHHIHDELTTHLCQQGFDVERGSTDDNKTYIQDIHEYKKKAKVLSELDQQIETKKQLLRDINDLHDEKEHLTRDIQNLKRKNHFLQEDSQQAQEDIDLYKQLRTISRDDFEKYEEKYQKEIKAYEASLSGLRMNYRDLDKRNQHLTTQNNQLEHHLDMLNARHQAMNDMVRNDTRILFAGLRCALKDRNIELSAEIKYQRMPEVGIDPDTVDQGALTHAYQGYVSGIDHHIRKASASIKKETEDDLELE